ncbi:DUF6064 family protein [Roseovarius tibetensis]|uniref:DUF6064 family protein n=1 Tax=Roseovarius tibetensis TaxID=2685897 RepID=UPI003D7F7EDD
METWLTYAPRDFLMFGPDVYWRLFELHNRSLWPLPLIAEAAGLACLVLLALRRTLTVRAAVILTALACLWAAYFLASRYAPINWTATYAAWGFGVEAGLLALLGLAGRPASSEHQGRPIKIVGWGLLALSIILYPFLTLMFGRPLAQAETFGLAPDPTAIACLGVLSLVSAGRWSMTLTVIPVLWCALSAATLMTLGNPQAWVLIATLLLWAFGLATAHICRT